MANKCKKCARYNPKAVANCRMQQSVYNLMKKLKMKLEVAECVEYLAPEKVFKEPKPKKVEIKEVGCNCEDIQKYGECECEG